MGAVGVNRAVELSWTNPTNRDFKFTAVFASQTNDLETATPVGSPLGQAGALQTWTHANLTPGDTWYYWLIAIDTSLNRSEASLPADPMDGWSATVTDAALTVTGMFTVTATGMTTTVTGTARYVIYDGVLVCLFVPNLSGTSNADGFTLTGLPAPLQPTQAFDVLQSAIDNGVAVLGRALFAVGSGTVTLYPGLTTTLWTASGTKSLRPTMFTYHLH